MKIDVIDLGAEDMILSFDVISVFTRVPVREALWVFEDLLGQD